MRPNSRFIYDIKYSEKKEKYLDKQFMGLGFKK